MQKHYTCFSHRECEFFPCHEGADPEHFNCLFCYCPLYACGEQCGGDFVILENGIKDCSGCLFPHRADNYDAVIERCKALCTPDKSKPPVERVV